MSYNRRPIEAFVRNLNLSSAHVIQDAGFNYYITLIAGVVEVAFFIDGSNVFIRAMDLVTMQEYEHPDDTDNKDTKKIRKAIDQYCTRFEGVVTPNSLPDKQLQAYRTIVGNPEADVCQRGTRQGGKKGRVNGRFIALEMLGYVLFHLGFYIRPPKPEYAPAWELIHSIPPLPGLEFSLVPLKTQQVTRRVPEAVPIVVSELSPPPEASRQVAHGKSACVRLSQVRDVHQDLLEARIRIQTLEQIRVVENREKDEKFKILLEQNKTLQQNHDKLWKEHAQTLAKRTSPIIRGLRSEADMCVIFKENVPLNCVVSKVGYVTNHADIMITYRDPSGPILGYAIIDIKHYGSGVTGEQVTKLERDIDACTVEYGAPPIWASVLSLNGGITHKKSLGLNYNYGTVPVFLVGDLMSRGEAGICHEIRQLIATGGLHISARTITGLQVEKIQLRENHPNSRILVDKKAKIFASDYVATTLPYLAKDDQLQEATEALLTSEEDADIVQQVQPSMPESVLREEAQDLPSMSVSLARAPVRKILDVRLFVDVSTLTEIKYRYALLLDSIICYKQGSTLTTLTVATRFHEINGLSIGSTRRVLNEICAYRVVGSRLFSNVSFRE